MWTQQSDLDIIILQGIHVEKNVNPPKGDVMNQGIQMDRKNLRMGYFSVNYAVAITGVFFCILSALHAAKFTLG